MLPVLESLRLEQMTRDEQLALVQAIWDRISSAQPLLTPAQRDELVKRAAEDDRAPDEVVPWEHAKQEILGRLQG